MQIDQLHSLLGAGVHHGASDIHFRPGTPPLYRVRGQLVPLKYDTLLPANTHAIVQHLTSTLPIKPDTATLQEFDTSYSLPGVARFRVNVYRQRGSLAVVLRIIPRDVPTVEQLGLPPVVSSIADSERGLVLVTGATGSGKSSTLAGMIHHINHTRAAHILTIEDPIEFLHANAKSSISQREIGLDTHNYVVGLRSALRQDPDVILLGEMRDVESCDIALKAAETGHLVFSTVHTTDAAKTVGRLTAMFPADEQDAVRNRIADNLRATISQRLLPRTDGKGRAVASEIMIVTMLIQEYIRDVERAGSLKDVIEKSRDQYQMQSFDQCLSDLYKGGTISLETAMQAATNPSDFERALAFE